MRISGIAKDKASMAPTSTAALRIKEGSLLDSKGTLAGRTCSTLGKELLKPKTVLTQLLRSCKDS